VATVIAAQLQIKQRKRDNPMPEWNKVQIQDGALKAASEMNKISEDDAFDLLLELLENAHFAVYKGTDPEGIEIYRLENDYLYIQGTSFINYSMRTNYSRKLRQQLHMAEDGRCEKCGLPMDKVVVSVKRRDLSVFNDFNNYILLCPDCNRGKSNPLDHAEFVKKTIAQYQQTRNISLEDAHNELMVTRSNLVLIYIAKKDLYRLYWAPGLGIFNLNNKCLYLNRHIESPKPVLERRPQARSRRWNSLDK
jgi:hypothetical protein